MRRVASSASISTSPRATEPRRANIPAQSSRRSPSAALAASGSMRSCSPLGKERSGRRGQRDTRSTITPSTSGHALATSPASHARSSAASCSTGSSCGELSLQLKIRPSSEGVAVASAIRRAQGEASPSVRGSHTHSGSACADWES
eukprot:scaffold76038_cov38-Tisochrysis_lutea.AAC.1